MTTPTILPGPTPTPPSFCCDGNGAVPNLLSIEELGESCPNPTAFTSFFHWAVQALHTQDCLALLDQYPWLRWMLWFMFIYALTDRIARATLRLTGPPHTVPGTDPPHLFRASAGTRLLKLLFPFRPPPPPPSEDVAPTEPEKDPQ